MAEMEPRSSLSRLKPASSESEPPRDAEVCRPYIAAAERAEWLEEASRDEERLCTAAGWLAGTLAKDLVGTGPAALPAAGFLLF